MQLAELDERNELVFCIRHAVTAGHVHCREQLFQCVDVSLADGRGNHEGRLRRHGQWTSRSRSRTNSRPHVGTAEDMRFLLPAVTMFSQLGKSAKRFCNYNKRLWIQEALTTNAAAVPRS